MTLHRRSFLGRVALVGAAGALAGCLDADQTDDTQPDDTETPTDAPDSTDTPESTDDADATVTTTDHPDLGEILADAEGTVLYLFTQDEGSESVCYDDCAENWPPLLVEDGDPVAGEGVTAELGTTERTDDTVQVTAAGSPLYYFAGDESPGDANGQGLNDVWFVLAPDGSMVESGDATPTPEPDDSDGGSDEEDDGYDYDLGGGT